MPQLHQSGVDLLLNLMDAQDHFDQVTCDELRQLIGEAVVVFGMILERDVPKIGLPSHPTDPPVEPNV